MPSDRTCNVLFLCTGNSARSILAEAVLNQVGGGRFQAYSAGSHPRGAVHPLSLDVLRRAGLPTEGLRSKSWDEFAAPDAPKMDFVFTVCDQAAGEACPIWPGQPMTAHWGIEDPAAVTGPEFRQRAAFEDALRFMRNRIAAFVSLPITSIDRMTLASRLRGIGAMDGATVRAPQGGVMLEHRPVAADAPELRSALERAKLPTGDLADPGRTFYRFDEDGVPVAFAGYELYGADALLRSVVVVPEARGRGIGRAVTETVLRHAYDAGARRAWLLTTAAEDFFARAGFAPASRATAPASILSTRQASSICSTAPLLTRPLAPRGSPVTPTTASPPAT